MMVPRKSGPGTTRSPLRRKKKSAVRRYVVLFLVLIVMVVAAAVAVSSSRKGARSKTKTQTAEGVSSRPRRVSRRVSAVGTKRPAERTRKDKRRDERSESRRASRQRRSERSQRGVSVRQDYSATHRLQMIVVGAQGQCLAVIGSRQYKTGDEIEGRKLSDVRADEVLVEYRGKTYTVRVGQQLY